MTKRLLILLLALAACGGTADSTTTIEPETTTTAGGGSDETVDFADMPRECIDAFVRFLQAIEPVVVNFDFDDASLDDLETMGRELESATAGPVAEMEGLDCPDPDGSDEEAFAAMIEIAEREAPGTVPYFRWIEEFAGSLEQGSGVTGSGDCETDIAALEALIADKESMGKLSLSEVTEVGELIGAITTGCSPDRTEEFFSQPEVEAFMNPEG